MPRARQGVRSSELRLLDNDALLRKTLGSDVRVRVINGSG